MVMSFCMNFAPGGGLIVTTEVFVLLLPVGSVVPETTVARLLSGPTGKVNGTRIFIVITAWLFGAVAASVPMLQVMVVVPVQVPCVDVAETSVTPPGKGSVTTTLVATDGPLFLAVIVYVISSPARTADALATLVIVKSLVGTGVEVTDV